MDGSMKSPEKGCVEKDDSSAAALTRSPFTLSCCSGAGSPGISLSMSFLRNICVFTAIINTQRSAFPPFFQVEWVFDTDSAAFPSL